MPDCFRALPPDRVGQFLLEFFAVRSPCNWWAKVMYDLRKQIFLHLQRLEMAFLIATCGPPGDPGDNGCGCAERPLLLGVGSDFGDFSPS